VIQLRCATILILAVAAGYFWYSVPAAMRDRADIIAMSEIPSAPERDIGELICNGDGQDPETSGCYTIEQVEAMEREAGVTLMIENPEVGTP
jgi:hypothetical protein